MKRIIFLVVMACLVTLGGYGLPPTAGAEGTHKEVAIVDFPDQVKLLGVFLKGQYMFVHDDEMMARGEACTYVYTVKDGQPDKLVVSFHCTPVARKVADRFTIKTTLKSTLLMVRDVTEIQFPGSSEAHLVPAS